MIHITAEDIKKIQEEINNNPYFCNDVYFCSELLEEEIRHEMLDIISNDAKFQEFIKPIMNKRILGE